MDAPFRISSASRCAAQLYTGKPLLQSKGNAQTYKAQVERVHPLSAQPGAEHVPQELMANLAGLLTAESSARLSELAFMSSPFFRDTLLRALTYCATLVDKTPAEKATFLSGLRQALPKMSVRLCERTCLGNTRIQTLKKYLC